MSAVPVCKVSATVSQFLPQLSLRTRIGDISVTITPRVRRVVSDRSAVGVSGSAMARWSSPASIHRGPVLICRRGSGRHDCVPAYRRHRGGSVFDTRGTSTTAATRSEREDHGYPTAESRPQMEQPFGRVTHEKSRAFCSRGVLFLRLDVSRREPTGEWSCWKQKGAAHLGLPREETFLLGRPRARRAQVCALDQEPQHDRELPSSARQHRHAFVQNDAWPIQHQRDDAMRDVGHARDDE
jgi:hypothetical protein